jgi:hypothetical protein
MAKVTFSYIKSGKPFSRFTLLMNNQPSITWGSEPSSLAWKPGSNPDIHCLFEAGQYREEISTLDIHN